MNERDPYVELRMPLLWRLIIPLNQRGITVDRVRRKKLQKERLVKAASWENRARRHFKRLGFDLPIGPKGGLSSQKVQEILYSSLDLPTKFSPKTGKPTAGKDALRDLRKHDSSGTVELLLENSRLKDAAVPLKSKESPDGRMRTRFVLGGDEKSDQNETGRSSPASGRLASRQVSKDPPLGTNLQNWTEWVRCILTAQSGWRLVKVDYSQIELRLTAHFSRDRNLLEAFDQGDAYTYGMYLLERETGMFQLGEFSLEDLQELKASGDERVSLCRDETKRLILGWTYRMGPGKMEEVKGIPYQRAKAGVRALDETFPGVVRWWRELERSVEESAAGGGWGHLENPWGRRRYFFPDDVPAFCNFLPQSCAADILFDAMEAIEERFQKRKPKLLLTVHDEVVVESPEPKRTVEEVRELMERPIAPLKGLRIPTEIYVGRNWAKQSKENLEGVKKV